jgi:hypothetical protein
LTTSRPVVYADFANRGAISRAIESSCRTRIIRPMAPSARSPDGSLPTPIWLKATSNASPMKSGQPRIVSRGRGKRGGLRWRVLAWHNSMWFAVAGVLVWIIAAEIRVPAFTSIDCRAEFSVEAETADLPRRDSHGRDSHGRVIANQEPGRPQASPPDVRKRARP